MIKYADERFGGYKGCQDSTSSTRVGLASSQRLQWHMEWHIRLDNEGESFTVMLDAKSLEKPLLKALIAPFLALQKAQRKSKMYQVKNIQSVSVGGVDIPLEGTTAKSKDGVMAPAKTFIPQGSFAPVVVVVGVQPEYSGSLIPSKASSPKGRATVGDSSMQGAMKGEKAVHVHAGEISLGCSLNKTCMPRLRTRTPQFTPSHCRTVAHCCAAVRLLSHCRTVAHHLSASRRLLLTIQSAPPPSPPRIIRLRARSWQKKTITDAVLKPFFEAYNAEGSGRLRAVASSRDIESITFTSDGPAVTVTGVDKDRALSSPVTLFAGSSWKLDIELHLYGAAASPSSREEGATSFQSPSRIDSDLAWTMEGEGDESVDFSRI